MDLETHLAWWSRQPFRSEQLCLCPPGDRADLCWRGGGWGARSPGPHLDAHDDALVLDDLGEELAAVGLLVQRLVEEDDPAHAAGHEGGVGGEEDVSEGAAVLLVVLHVDLLQTLAHGSWTDQGSRVGGVGGVRFCPDRLTSADSGLTC